MVLSARLKQLEKATRLQTPPVGTGIKTSYGEVHYLSLGVRNKDLIPVVMLHGLGGSIRDMSFKIGPGIARKTEVILLDRPGHGYTKIRKDTPSDHPEDQAKILLEALNLIGLNRFILVGQSYGSVVAMQMAIMEPSRIAGMCLVSGAFHDRVPTSRLIEIEALMRFNDGLLTLLSAASPEFLIDLYLRKIFHPSPVPAGYKDHFGPRAALVPEHLHAMARQATCLREALLSQMREHHHLNMPIRIIHGEKDHILPIHHAEEGARRIPGSVFTRIPDGGHMIHQTHSDLVIGDILSLLGDPSFVTEGQVLK